MNDPYVVALQYKVKHRDSVHYDQAKPLTYEDDQLKLHVDNKNVKIWPKQHYSTQKEAQEAIKPFIARWEFKVAIEDGHSSFKLLFDRAETSDLAPNPSAVHWSIAVGLGASSLSSPVTVGHSTYPAPPSDHLLEPDDPTAQLMLSRLEGYRQGKEPLGQMAYFCLTAAELHAATATGSNDRRKAAADYYCVSQKALNKLGELSAERGGAEARKAAGLASSYTANERNFLLKAVQALIFRAAERAANPTGQPKTITLADLPKLP